MKMQRIFTLLAFLMILFMAAGTVSADLNDGLVAHYPFNGNANDESGNGNHGTLFGGPIFTTGKIGQALDFDGVHDYIQVSHNTSYKPKNISISFWVRPNFSTPSWAKIITLPYRTTGLSSPFYTFSIGRYSGNDYTQFIVNTGATWHEAKDISGTEWSKGEWFFVTLTYDGDMLRGYIDGQEVANNTSLSGDIDYTGGNTDLSIGMRSIYSSGEFYQGQIDDVRIYNRALTALEIQELFNMGNVVNVSFDIKPGHCPNILHGKGKRGKVKVAILGTEHFKVDTDIIDIATIRLNGVAPKKFRRYKDVSSPRVSGLDPCDCDAFTPDTYKDLVLKFSKKEFIKSIVETFGEIPDGNIPLELTGNLLDGTPIKGLNCIQIRKRHRGRCNDDDSSGSDDGSSDDKKWKKWKKHHGDDDSS